MSNAGRAGSNGHPSRRRGAAKAMWASINFSGAIASLVALWLYLAKDYLGHWGVLILGVASILAISAYLAYMGKVVFERTSANLLSQVGEAQQETVDAIQKAFSDELGAKTLELTQKSAQLDSVVRAIEDMSRLSLRLRRIEYEATNDDSPKVVVQDLLRHTLIELSALFETISGSPCRICIKMVYDHVDSSGSTQRAVKAIARSNTPRSEHRESPDLVVKNTDFSAIIFNREKYWFCANIHDKALVPQYSNTSDTLPYSSVIVWPLRTFEARSTKESDYPPKDKLGDVIGFLCLDSEVINAFRKDRELLIGWWFVDTLAGVVDQLLEKQLITM